MLFLPEWWKYVVFYPEADEEDYDGVHDGGVKGLTDDAPEEMKNKFEKFIEELNSGVKS